jgi:outer membrane lipoprotein-sorting protein
MTLIKVFLCLIVSSTLVAKTINTKQIIEKIDNLYRHKQSFAKVTMNIYKPYLPGNKRSVSMRIWSKGNNYTLLKIDKPAKEKGIATLKRDKNLWNFFPKIDKTIKLSSSMMMGSWMGSNFSNDDLVKESSILQDYNHQLESTDPKFYLISLTPKKSSLWAKIVIKINKKLIIPISYSYFNENLEKTRELTFSSPKIFAKNSAPIPSKLVMRPLDRPDEYTEIIYQQINFNIKLEEDFFSLRNLKRKLNRSER